MALKDLIAKFLHDVKVRLVNHSCINDLKAIDPCNLDSLLIENMDVVIGNNNETVLINVLLSVLVTYKL